MFIFSSGSFVVKYVHQQARMLLSCSAKLQSDEFKEGLERALCFAEKNKVKHWLLNVREIGRLGENEEIWLQSYFFPKIMSSLGSDNFVAIVVSEKCYNALLMEAGRFGLKSYNSFIIINTFCDLEEAVEWLEQEAMVASAG